MPPTARLEVLAHRPVRANVRAAEPVNRLLRIADDEQLARLRSGIGPSIDAVVFGGEQEQNLRLHRIGVLELVDKNPRESLLQAAPYIVVRAQQVARADEQIRKVE